MLLVMVGKWVKQFDAGRIDVHNLERSGCPSDSMTFVNIPGVHDLLEEDRHMTISELAYVYVYNRPSTVGVRCTKLYTIFFTFGNFRADGFLDC